MWDAGALSSDFNEAKRPRTALSFRRGELDDADFRLLRDVEAKEGLFSRDVARIAPVQGLPISD
jgi:hypothetical protein